jgi:NTE family protein
MNLTMRLTPQPGTERCPRLTQLEPLAQLARLVKLVPLALAVALALGVSGGNASAAEARAEGDSPAKRPKVCVVLSGGGARGAAHVGVLKVLEEYRVPVDCIIGTSMGSLVGAAYATGMSISDMEDINASITTELLFKEKPPRQELSMRRKEDDKTLLVGPEFGVKNGGLSFGKGLVSGVQLETVLRRLSKVKGYHHFDELPIPFRAVATDLVLGQAVVFKDGEIANVTRASMSVPGAVAPVEIGGKILVDGMLTSNLPVETALAMGADIIIAVNVGTPLLTREQLDGILGVAGQMLSILTEQNVRNSLALLRPDDVLISPELGTFSTGDFDSLPKIAPLGELAARKMADRLSRLSLPVNEYAALRQRQTAIVSNHQSPVDEIRFDKLEKVNQKSALAVMDTQARQAIDQEVLDADMRRLYGTGDFEHVNYRFMEESGKHIMAVEAIEKSWGADYLRFGLGLSSDFKGNAYFNLAASFRRTWLNSLGGEWRTDMQVGRNSKLSTGFYQPLNAEGSFFVAPGFTVEHYNVPLFRGDNQVAIYNVGTNQASLDLGTQFLRYGTLRVGVMKGDLRQKLETGSEAFKIGEGHFAQAGYTASLNLDRLDSAQFPRSGWGTGVRIFNSSSTLGAEKDYTKWELDAQAAYPFGNHALNFAVRVGGKAGKNPLPLYDQFSWGGLFRLSGYATGQFSGQDLTFGRMMYYHKIMQGKIFEGAYAGFSLEAGKVGSPIIPTNNSSLIKAGSLFMAVDSPLGPVYLSYGRATDGHNSFYFYLGNPF